MEKRRMSTKEAQEKESRDIDIQIKKEQLKNIRRKNRVGLLGWLGRIFGTIIGVVVVGFIVLVIKGIFFDPDYGYISGGVNRTVTQFVDSVNNPKDNFTQSTYNFLLDEIEKEVNEDLSEELNAIQRRDTEMIAEMVKKCRNTANYNKCLPKDRRIEENKN